MGKTGHVRYFLRYPKNSFLVATRKQRLPPYLQAGQAGNPYDLRIYTI